MSATKDECVLMSKVKGSIIGLMQSAKDLRASYQSGPQKVCADIFADGVETASRSMQKAIGWDPMKEIEERKKGETE